uniref:NADH dehydrogenase subunit 6 n=1 Tax=Purohita sinica TaxID=871393 RepID=A0A7S4YZ22_9HEMI|nr:NADH dehydrogenase subunit 6 [Purohita sinica]
MKFMILMMFMNSIISTKLKHPISLGSILMIQSIFTSMNMIMMTKNSWYSMILFISFSSGMMIMFMYMASISSNEKFKSSIKMFKLVLIMILMIMLLNLDWNLLFEYKINEQNISIQENEEKISMIKTLSFNKINLTIMLTVTILIVLVSISNLINSFEGPLKLTYEKLN